MDALYSILGLAMITSQIRAIVIMFGGDKKASKARKARIGVGLIFMLLSIIGLASGS